MRARTVAETLRSESVTGNNSVIRCQRYVCISRTWLLYELDALSAMLK